MLKTLGITLAITGPVVVAATVILNLTGASKPVVILVMLPLLALSSALLVEIGIRREDRDGLR